jgi:hypothetical protein
LADHAAGGRAWRDLGAQVLRRGVHMRKVRLAALGLAAVSIVAVATPASANGDVLSRATGKYMEAWITDCPVAPEVGTRCAAWRVYADQFRVSENGTVQKTGFLGLEKYRILITSDGFSAVFAADGFSVPDSFRISDNLSSARVSGKVEVTYYTESCVLDGSCRTKWIPVSVRLSANAPATRDVIRFPLDEECRIIFRDRFRYRTADGTAKVNGISFVTTILEDFPSVIGHSRQTVIQRGDCDYPETADL